MVRLTIYQELICLKQTDFFINLLSHNFQIFYMDPKSTAIIQEVIAKLQELLGEGSKGPSDPSIANIPDFDAKFAQCVEKSKTLSPEIQKLTAIFEAAIHYMKQILGFSTSSKKYSPFQEEKLKQKFMKLSKDTEQFQKTNVEYIDHSKTIRQLLSIAFWVFVPTPEFLVKGAIESANFNAIKFQKKKNLDVNQWYKLLQISILSLEKFVLEGYSMGISFNPNGKDNWNIIINGSGSNAPSQDTGIKQQVPKVDVPKGPVVIKKIKKREMIGQTLNFTNFENEVIEIKTGQIEMKHGIYVEKCKGLTLKIEPKFKTIILSKCQSVNLQLNTCISGVQIINSKDLTVYIHQKTPSVSVDSSQIIRLIINQDHLDCDIVSTKATQLTVSSEKGPGNQSKPFMIGEQLITKWNLNSTKFETSIYDKFL